MGKKAALKIPEPVLLRGDCLKYLPELKPKAYHLAVLDPPYNLGKEYDSYDDTLTTGQYLHWFRQRIAALVPILHPQATVWLFINDGLVSECDVICKEEGLKKRTHVCWHYTFGQHNHKNFVPSHTHVLRFSRSASKWTFNADAIRVPSARQLKYNDKRANGAGRVPDNTWVLFPEQLPEGWNPAGDTWLESRVCGTFHERKHHSPNQLPLPLVERIVLSTSNPGDLVIDPFMGAGTTGVVCRQHGRQFVGIDISPTCVKESRKRIYGKS